MPTGLRFVRTLQQCQDYLALITAGTYFRQLHPMAAFLKPGKIALMVLKTRSMDVQSDLPHQFLMIVSQLTLALSNFLDQPY